MARLLRVEFAGAIYHLTSRGNARQRVFFTDADRELFLMSAVQIVQAVQSFHYVQAVQIVQSFHFLQNVKHSNIGSRRSSCSSGFSSSRQAPN
jgi:REP-associated tyrosine transposase